jgi:hypothetical protein
MDPRASAPITLHCLPGRSPPPELAGDLGRLRRLPAPAQGRLWEALGPSLREPMAREVEARLSAFCQQLGADPDELAPLLRACRFLLRAAARLDLASARFAEDLAALGADARTTELLLAGYEKAKSVLRLEILESTLTEHGKLLLGVDWRHDTINASQHGSALAAPVAVLTLRYQEGKQEQRLTLQALPSVLEQLERACAELRAARG